MHFQVGDEIVALVDSPENNAVIKKRRPRPSRLRFWCRQRPCRLACRAERQVFPQRELRSFQTPAVHRMVDLQVRPDCKS